MALAAAQVIDAIAARISGLALAGNRVYTSRAWPLTEADLPAARVLAGDEEVRALTVHPNTLQEHTLDVDIEGYVRHINTVDDAMHALAEAGLALLFTEPLPHGLQLVGINRDTSSEGVAAVARITLQLQCTYFVAPAAPGVILS
jgi:hypothetical protein